MRAPFTGSLRNRAARMKINTEDSWLRTAESDTRVNFIPAFFLRANLIYCRSDCGWRWLACTGAMQGNCEVEGK